MMILASVKPKGKQQADERGGKKDQKAFGRVLQRERRLLPELFFAVKTVGDRVGNDVDIDVRRDDRQPFGKTGLAEPGARVRALLRPMTILETPESRANSAIW